MGGAVRLAALVLASLPQVAHAAPPAPCGCALFVHAAAPDSSSQAIFSPQARKLRDFALFSHRRIGADLIRARGPYLSTLSSAFPHCADESIKLAWLRQMFGATSDTRQFAERVAQQLDSSRACPADPS